MSPPNRSAEPDDPRTWPRAAADGMQTWPRDAGCCIWMEAGLIAYKLCDRDYRCEACPFDAVMRGSNAPDVAGPLSSASGATSGLATLPRDAFPADRSYHPAHTWVEVRDPERLRIGLDALAARLADRTTGVVLPVRGQRLEQGKVGSWLLDEAGPLALHMPAEGHVIGLNPALKQRPRLAIEEPYGAGWLLELACSDARALEGLVSAAEMAARANAELAALRERATALGRRTAIGPGMVGPRVGPTLLDGGTLHSDLRTALGPAGYHALVQPILAGHSPVCPSAGRPDCQIVSPAADPVRPDPTPHP